MLILHSTKIAGSSILFIKLATGSAKLASAAEFMNESCHVEKLSWKSVNFTVFPVCIVLLWLISCLFHHYNAYYYHNGEKAILKSLFKYFKLFWYGLVNSEFWTPLKYLKQSECVIKIVQKKRYVHNGLKSINIVLI